MADVHALAVRVPILAAAAFLACAGCGPGEDESAGRPPDWRTPDREGTRPQPPHPMPFPAPTPIGEITLARTLPHEGWSEGLDIHEGELWHAFPGSIRVFDLSSGAELREVTSPSSYNESIAWRGGELWNVSNDDSNVYVGRPSGADLEWRIAGTTPEVHGWGITHDPEHVIVTGSGSRMLYFLDPQSVAVVRAVETPVDDLEDLAWDRGAIWASSYSEYSGQFFRIDPATGAIVDVHALPDAEECAIVDGLAVDGRSLYVTGKRCPWIYVYDLP